MEAYADELMRATRSVLAHYETSPDAFNAKWRELGRCFPFSVPELVLVHGNDTTAGDPDCWPVTIRNRSGFVRPQPNPFFPASVGGAGGEAWGDFANLAGLVGDSIAALLEISGRDTSSLAQVLAHEFKNMSQETVKKTGALSARLLRERVPTRIVEDVETLCKQCLFMNASSLALLYGLGVPPSHKYAPIEDMQTLRDVVHAAASVAVGLFARDRTATFSGVKPLDEAMPSLALSVGLGKTGTATTDLHEAVVLAVAPFAEVVRNVRTIEAAGPATPVDAKIRVSVDEAERCVLLEVIQKQFEANKPEVYAFRSGSLDRLCERTFSCFGMTAEFGEPEVQEVEKGRFLVRVRTALRIARLYRWRYDDG
jgi:hypothetical protein